MSSSRQSLDFRRVVIDTDCLEVVKILKHSSHALIALGRSSSRNGLSLSSPPADLSLLVEEEEDRSTGEPVIPQEWCATANVACFNLHSDPGG
ncbi:hypothetical protein V6N12_068319 [Hibiscus sabdariffa]|uniref:Uncharacterized protein n=1 Tax=Hibiscus sabdariffa TaxID=183260 RepID=A0ABR2FPY1_9ROSI